jgi:SAM-dependent methyltransferase
MTVLDLGCGDGRTSGLWLRDHGCDYIGADIADNALAEAEALGLKVKRIDDAGSLPFDSAHFDVVICVEVLEHLFSPHLAVAEAHRVLKPGGKLIATVPNVAYWRRRLDLAILGRWNPLGDEASVNEPWRDPHIRFFNPGALRRLLKSQGYVDVQIKPQGGSLIGEMPWLGRYMRRADRRIGYQLLEKLSPSLFGYRLAAVARRPAD